MLFPETGKRLGGRFLQYWRQNGGLMQQGYPISDEFFEVSDLDGKPYTVQYFERAVFELHPENRPPYDVLLSQLGTFRFAAQYQSDLPGIPGDTASLLANARTRELIRKEIEACSRDFKGYEAVRDFVLSAEELTPANDMLTPTLKLKRRNVNARYESQLQALYKASA